ncbi:MAG: hypothetical protein LUM44_24595 [Pyrinomonadaceae bacterium]|nr:hypothetical protein [Pyrinomonadaceae bacterium]
MTLKLKIFILTMMCGSFLLASAAYSQDKNGADKVPATPSTAKNVKKDLPEITGWEKNGSMDMSDPSEDYIVDYQSESAGRVTVYVYSRGLPAVPDGIKDALIIDEFNGAKGAIFQLAEVGIYTDVKEIKNETVTLGGKPGKIQSLHSNFTFKAKGTPLVSEIFLFGKQNKFIKIRATRPKDQEASGQSAMDTLLSELDKFFSN